MSDREAILHALLRKAAATWGGGPLEPCSGLPWAKCLRYQLGRWELSFNTPDHSTHMTTLTPQELAEVVGAD